MNTANTDEVAVPVTEAAVQQRKKQHDYCVGIRKAYAGLLSGLSSNNILAFILCGSPFYYILGFSIYSNSGHSSASSLFGASPWIFMGILLSAWLLSALSMWKTMPNLLTASIFIYTTIGHWCIVSGFIIMIYGSSQLPASYTGYLLAALVPSVIFLLFSGDLLRAVRKRMYDATAATAATATTLV